MRHRSRSVALAVAAAGLLGAAPPAPRGADVIVIAKDLRSDRGVVRACLTPVQDRFPKCDDPGRSFKAIGHAAGTVTIAFHGIPPGRYAVALLHDENNNGKADRAAMMIPKEGFGFSRDAKVRFGPPRFRDAAFDVASGADAQQVIRMRYLL